MRKIIKWTVIFVAMFGISTLLSMVAGNDVSWAAFTDETNWGVGVLFAPLLTAACWALWPTPTYSPFEGMGCCCCNCINCNSFCFFSDTDPSNRHLITNTHYESISDDNWMEEDK